MQKFTHVRSNAIFVRRIAVVLATSVLAVTVALPAWGEAPLSELEEPSIEGQSTQREVIERQNTERQAIERQNLERRNNVRKLLLLNECRSCDLQGMTITETHLIGADLRDANLQGADFSGSNLEGADFENANLTAANFSDTFLTNAKLANARLDGVDFSRAHLYSVDVSGASMQNLNLAGAQIHNTPIAVGGGTQPLEEGRPLRVVPFGDTKPPFGISDPVEPYEVPLPILQPQILRPQNRK